MDVRKYMVMSLCVIAFNTHAEIYRWVDKDGKVHFTDRKPAPEAENITKEVKSHNIDTSSNELNKIVAMRDRDERERREQTIREQQGLQPELDKQRQAYCERQKERLRKISGYVVFTDDEGKVVKVTEQQRQQKVAEQKQIIKDTCS
jgi:hypothetical protein